MQIPSEFISFTYGDSMASLKKKGKITMVTKEQILETLINYSGSLVDFMADIEKRFGYIEVQLWHDEYCKIGGEKTHE